MKLRKGKIFLLVIGFVFLFLVNQFHSSPDSIVVAEKKTVVDSARAQTINSTSSVAVEERKSGEADVVSSQEGQQIENVSYQFYKVAKVVDGDTIDIIMNGRTERLRLIGVNTPEVVDPRKPVECFGREASANAKKLLSGQEVRVEADATQDDRDKYGRLLRYVWRADGLFYNLEAIRSGFAYEYTYQIPYIYQKEFKAAQKYAEENKFGLWADGACGAKNIKPAATSVSTKGGCAIKGNVGAKGDKIYHLPNCPYYKNTVINESQGEKWFCSEAEALAAGWRKAQNCP